MGTGQLWVLLITLVVSRCIIIWRINGWADTVNSRLISLEGFVNEFRKDIQRLFERINPASMKRRSLIQLTEYGQKISNMASVSNWMQEEAKGKRI